LLSTAIYCAIFKLRYVAGVVVGWINKKAILSHIHFSSPVQEFTFGVAHEYDVDAIMGGIEVLEDGDFIRYGDLLCTLIPLRKQKLRIDEAGPNEPEATPYDPSSGSFTDTPDVSGFHAPHGSGLGTMHENPNVMENSGTFGAQQASTSTPDWVQAKSSSSPGVSNQSSISASLTSPGRQSAFSVPMPITMPQIGEMKGEFNIGE
jgi:hypothetical protein